MTLSPEIIYLFAGTKYLDAIYVIPPVAASVYFVFVYALFSTIEFYYQKTSFISTATMLCAGLNLLLNYIFIKKYGYYAAGYTTLFCYICLTVFHFSFYKTVMKKESIKQIYDEKRILVIGVFVLVVMFVMLFTYEHVAIRYSIMAGICFLLVSHRKRIGRLIKK